MKKIQLSTKELEQMSISNEELSRLQGGYIADINSNSHETCNCKYNDRSAFDTNTNSVSGCKCTCV